MDVQHPMGREQADDNTQFQTQASRRKWVSDPGHLRRLSTTRERTGPVSNQNANPRCPAGFWNHYGLVITMHLLVFVPLAGISIEGILAPVVYLMRAQ